MARITLRNTAVSAAVGLIDVADTEIDSRMGLTKPMVNATDLVRTAGVFVSLGLNYLGYMEQYTDVAFYSFLPLFTRTLYVIARTQFLGGPPRAIHEAFPGGPSVVVVPTGGAAVGPTGAAFPSGGYRTFPSG